MKKILTVCLLGILSLTQLTAGTLNVKALQKTIECDVEGYQLLSESDIEDGRITRVKIYNSTNQCILDEEFNSFSVYVDLSELKTGNYTAKVYTQYSPVHSHPFSY